MQPASVVLQAAISALKADPAVSSIVGSRVFDVPPGPREALPYVYLGPARFTYANEFGCAAAWRIQFRLYTVSDSQNRMQAWDAAFAVARALHRKSFPAPAGWAFPRKWEAAQGGDIIDPLKLKECFVDVTAMIALNS